MRQLYVRGSQLERFMARVIAKDDGCWEWTGYRDTKGYGAGYARFDHRMAYALGYELFIGPVPEGLELDHLCRNRACVNPTHLEPVTHAENMRRSAPGSEHQEARQVRAAVLCGMQPNQGTGGSRMTPAEALRELHRLFQELYTTDWTKHPPSAISDIWQRIHVANIQTRGLR